MTILLIYCTFALIALLGLVEQRNATFLLKGSIRFAILLLLIAFTAFRSPGFGSDDMAYMDMFQGISRSVCHDVMCSYDYGEYGIEIGFFFLLLLLTNFGYFSSVLFGAVSAISIFVNWVATKKLYPYVSPPILLYYAHHLFNKEFNALRLSIAAAFVLYSGVCCVYRKYHKALLFVFLGAFFQVSAVIAIAPILLCYLLSGRRALVIFFVTVVAVSLLFPIGRVYESLSIVEFIGNKITLYASSDEYHYKIDFFDPVNVKNFAVLVLCFLSYEQISKHIAAFRVCLVFFMFATLIRFVFSDFAIIAGRGFGVVSVFECFLIPVLAVHFFGKWWGYVATIFYSLSILSLNMFIMLRWSGGVGYFGEYFF